MVAKNKLITPIARGEKTPIFWEKYGSEKNKAQINMTCLLFTFTLGRIKG